MDEQYYDIERRTSMKESARELRRKFLRYKDAEVVYSMTHKKLLELAGKAVDIECSLYNITGGGKMAETKKGTELKKWDEVNGVASEELQEAIPASETDAYAKLQMNDLVRNPLRGIEDLVEQNDNQLDGVINNMPAETVAEQRGT